MTKLFMIIGLPASGKSTVAMDFAKMNNANIHSSDKIREEWYGDESIQGDNVKIFEEIFNCVVRQFVKSIHRYYYFLSYKLNVFKS